MTESAYFATASQGECYKDLDVENYEVIETLDSHTCSFCGEMDGKVFPVNKMQAGSTAPPFHPWCRGTTAPYYEDMVGVGQRFARDADGKTYTVPSDMTYAEWKEIYVNKTSTIEEWMVKRVDKTVKNGIMNIRVDEFVPCLKDAKTGEILQTDIRDIQRSDLLKYNRKTGWYLDWKKDTPKDQHVLGLFLKDDTEAQGLISIRHDEGGTFMAFAEAAPHNNKYLTGNQKYIGVGGHLVAAAIKESVMNGNGGCVYGYAADQRLLEHFIKNFGAAHYPFSHPYQFVIEGKAAQKVLDIYTFERK